MNAKLVVFFAILMFLLPATAQEQNLTEGCITDYNANVDYFPEKVEILDAERFAVAYHNHYKVVSVSDAYDGAPGFDYVLVQCGAPAPPASDFADGAQFIEVPAGDIIALSTTQLPALAQLDLLRHLAGVDSAFYISTVEVVDAVADGQIAEVGFGAQINIELVLSLEPQLVMSYGFNPATDAHPVLLEAGVFTALDASWRELSPLGRAEWLKFTALFYNREAAATEIYDNIASEYENARQIAASVSEADRPNVLINSFLGYADAWFIPGQETYVGRLIRDAGGELLLAEEASTASQGLSFEAVYEGGLGADVWLVETFGVSSQAELLALDSRFGDFAAFQAGDVWNNNADENANGGNNYYEWGVTNPHLVLRDLVAIFHPDLLPEREFVFYQRLASEQDVATGS
ncbi:MAG: ABC transporter substrate-binding protein [Chloroflexota bacterium]|nr:ABC transporter substrate-binding protein [Chloroflexota bacterium]